MLKAAKEKEDGPRAIDMRPQVLTVCLLGQTPLIFNRQSEKARRGLLYPSGPKTKGEKATTLKHEPLEEFRASPYINRDEDEASLFHFPSGAFKKAIASAAVDMPGIARSQINRLCSVATTQISIFGKPYLKADMVRQAGMSRTPDVRFRCCLKQWACSLDISFMGALISGEELSLLVGAAGLIIGIGDYRVEKGAGDFGQFRVVDRQNKAWLSIIANQGRTAQVAAMENVVYYDDETESLVEWFYDESARRRNTPRVVTQGKQIITVKETTREANGTGKRTRGSVQAARPTNAGAGRGRGRRPNSPAA
jgi:hypothetical protein